MKTTNRLTFLFTFLFSFLFICVTSLQCESKEQDKLVVYYFHGNKRCINCIKIEKYLVETIRENFSSQVNSKQIDLEILNFETKENSHFVDHYELYTKSIVLSKRQNNKEQEWKVLDKIWLYLTDEKAAKNYIKIEINDYLKEFKKG